MITVYLSLRGAGRSSNLVALTKRVPWPCIPTDPNQQIEFGVDENGQPAGYAASFENAGFSTTTGVTVFCSTGDLDAEESPDLDAVLAAALRDGFEIRHDFRR